MGDNARPLEEEMTEACSCSSSKVHAGCFGLKDLAALGVVRSMLSPLGACWRPMGERR